MNRLSRLGIVAGTGLALSLTTSPAWAHDDSPPEGSGPWLPAEELDPTVYDPIDIEACGTTVTVAIGDVREAEGRETVLPNGDTLLEGRGALTADITRHDTGEVIDELDISGPLTELISADGSHVTAWVYGPAVLFPIPDFGPVDAAAFEAAGIPDLAYFKKGLVTFHVVVNPETGEFISEEADVDAHLHDLCTWFDDDRGHAHADAYAYAYGHGSHG